MKRDILAPVLGLLAVTGATLFSITGVPLMGARDRPVVAPSDAPPRLDQERIIELPPEPPALADLVRWLALGAEGKRWSDYDLVMDVDQLRIVVRAADTATPEELRDSCLNITSLVHLWDPLFQIHGQIVQIGLESTEPLASCTLREPVPGGHPPGDLSALEEALGSSQCWTFRCA